MSGESTDIQSENNTSSYRSIFKATSLFGGVQAYQILIGVIKSKFVAILLGPAGMGIQGLYQSAIQLIQSFSSLGLSQSAVRDVSEANGSGDSKRIGLTVAVVKRLVWITGLLGLIVTAVLSPVLSKTTFGNYDFTIPFIFLSVILLLDQLSAGQKVVLQGMRKLKYLAKSTAIGSTIGLVVSIPLYYLFGIHGIVPTLILNSVTMLCLTWYFSKKVEVENVQVTNIDTIQHGKSMMKMGLAMSVSGIMSTITYYFLVSFIRFEGGSDQVGLYTSGYMLVNSYVGLVFNAMATDYYPRLSAINHDNHKCSQVINQQGEIATLIIAPILISCLILMPFIIRIIYSEDFFAASDYILWAVLGVMFKAFSWSIAFVFLAKAKSKLYIINEIIANIYFLIINISCYHYFGLSGLGVAYIVCYLLYGIQVYLIAKIKFNIVIFFTYKKIFLFQLLLVSSVCILLKIYSPYFVYILVSVLFIICCFYSINELNKRTKIFEIIKNKLK